LSFWTELKRRNVFRVAAAYLVIAWLIVQVADVMADGFGFPEWFMPMLFVMLGLGFPVALVFSWAFEITPEGVKRERDVNREASITPHTGKRLDLVTIGAVVLAVLVLGVDRFWLTNRTSPDTSNPTAQTASVEDTEDSDPEAVESESDSTENAIAVLPFADMSPEGDQEYFSDGLSEEILNLLAQIKELKVIGRTSSFAFKGRNVDLRKIGEQLGAAYILEGSVRKSGDQLRITAQLIEADNGTHLWSESFDRQLENVFQIQDEIAGAIVDTLEVSLTGGERRAAEAHGTDSMPAYERFLEARRLIQGRTRADIEVARGLLDEALELDPQFAPALTARAQVALLLSDSISTYGDSPIAESGARADALLERALSVNPKLAFAHAVCGLRHLLVRDFGRASKALARALELNPSHGDALNWRLYALGSAGQTTEGIAVAEKAVKMDPLNLVARDSLLVSYTNAGRFEDAIEAAVRTQSDFPDAHFGYLRKSEALRASGRLADALPAVEQAQELAPDIAAIQYSAANSYLLLGQYEVASSLIGIGQVKSLIALDQTDQAVTTARERLEQAPDAWIWLGDMLRTLSWAGRHDQVLALYNERFETPEAMAAFFGADLSTTEVMPVAIAMKAQGRKQTLRDLLAHWGRRLDQLREQGRRNPEMMFLEAAHASLSDQHEKALEKLARAIDAGHRDPLLARNPAFSGLTDDPAFQAQVDRMIELINAERAKLDLEPLT
jgi:TolB-like protein/tetratricopeptide (TPR) repeat protein